MTNSYADGPTDLGLGEERRVLILLLNLTSWYQRHRAALPDGCPLMKQNKELVSLNSDLLQMGHWESTQ